MRVRLAAVGALACALVFMVGGAGAVPSTSLVISQVYGGGGNSGAPFTHDYIEIFNKGTSSVALSAYSLQYASATGTGNFGGTATQLTELPNVTLQPGQYFLVQEAGGTTGVPLPTPDHIDPTPIAMAAGAGKVALATGTSSLGCNGSSTPCDAAQLARIVDLVGYGSANFFEGSGPAPGLANDRAAFRNAGGCTDTDNNASDFVAAAPAPRNSLTPLHFCDTEAAPSVASTSPANGATNVALDSNLTITFSEPVDVSGAWYSVSCATSGAHTAVQSGGPQSFTLDPDADFAFSEPCTVTIFAAQVSDQDALDPPDTMAADHVFGFTTEAPPVAIHDIQGARHISPFVNQTVSGVEGIVTAKRPTSFWVQDPNPDFDPATSEGIFVFGSGAAALVNVGDHVRVSGRVVEFRQSGRPNDLTITEITSPSAVVVSSGNPVPAPTVIGIGGLMPPTEVIDDDTSGDVETGPTTFDPANDGIDFWESLEGMLLQVNDGAVVNETESFGEITLLPDAGFWATGLRTPRGGILARSDYGDFNPERFIVDDEILRDLITPRPPRAMPEMNVGDRILGAIVGPLDYTFSNFKIQALATPAFLSGNLQPEVADAPTDQELAVGTFNVENLDPGDGPLFDRLAHQIVDNLRSPDLIGIEEVQDNSGPANNGVVDASETWRLLIEAITRAGGPLYEHRQIDPVDNEDGGQPGANIRVGFLFRTDRGLSFVDRPGGDSVTPTEVLSTPSGPQLSLSPGRIDPDNPAFIETRKSLAGEFRFRGKKLFVVVNHFSSKGDDQPLMGRFQPPNRLSEIARHGQAEVVNDFVNEILAIDSHADVIVLGDINDFEFSETVEILEGDGELFSAIKTLPAVERYSYVFEGNSQVLDQILLSRNLYQHFPFVYDVVHVNSEFAGQASDHEPSVTRIRLTGRPTTKP